MLKHVFITFAAALRKLAEIDEVSEQPTEYEHLKLRCFRHLGHSRRRDALEQYRPVGDLLCDSGPGKILWAADGLIYLYLDIVESTIDGDDCRQQPLRKWRFHVPQSGGAGIDGKTTVAAESNFIFAEPDSSDIQAGFQCDFSWSFPLPYSYR